MEPSKVITRYCDLIWQYKKRAVFRPDVHHPDDRNTAQRFILWCGEQQVDPLRFMTYRLAYANRRGGKLPAFKSLRSERMLGFAREQFGQQDLPQPLALAKQTVLDLRMFQDVQEYFRERHLRNATTERCRVLLDASGGYDPRSKFCCQCPSAAACERDNHERWGFSVTALRLNRLHEVPKHIAQACV